MALTYRWGHYNLTEVLDIQSDTHVADIIKVKGRKANDTVQTYYDTEVQGWRCYKIANLITE